MSIGLWRMRWGECECTDSGVGYDVSSVSQSVLLGGRECSTRTSLSDLAIAEKFVFFFVFLSFFLFCFMVGGLTS